MKKIISMFLGTMVFCNMAFAVGKIVTVKKHNGGTNGYLNISEKHPEKPGEVTHTLDCNEPGSKACLWEKDPYAIIAQTEAEDIVEGQIGSHHYSGEMGISGGSITWEGSGPYNYTYTITEN